MPAHPLGYNYINDVWYKFTAATATAQLDLANVSTNILVKVFNSTLTSVISFDGGATGAINSNTTFGLSGLTVGQEYYLRIMLCAPPATVVPNGILQNFSICISGVPTVAIADGAVGTCALIDGPVTSNNAAVWKHFTDAGKLLASVFDAPGGAGMGLMTGRYYRNTGSIRYGFSPDNPYLDRNFEITPTTQPTNPVRVKFYFTVAELNRMIAASTSLRSINDLRFIKFSAAPCNSFISNAGGVFDTPISYGQISPDILYIEVLIPSFSSFFIGTDSLMILPNNEIIFDAILNNHIVNIKWRVNKENAIQYFDIEKSFDGKEFATIIRKNASTINEYEYNDLFANKETFYRIKAVMKDGKTEYTKTKLIKPIATNSDIILYPNPVDKTIQINITANKPDNTQHIDIFDNLGKLILQKKINILQGNQTIAVDLSTLKTGNYYLRLYVDGISLGKAFTKY